MAKILWTLKMQKEIISYMKYKKRNLGNKNICMCCGKNELGSPLIKWKPKPLRKIFMICKDTLIRWETMIALLFHLSKRPILIQYLSFMKKEIQPEASLLRMRAQTHARVQMCARTPTHPSAISTLVAERWTLRYVPDWQTTSRRAWRNLCLWPKASFSECKPLRSLTSSP